MVAKIAVVVSVVSHSDAGSCSVQQVVAENRFLCIATYAYVIGVVGTTVSSRDFSPCTRCMCAVDIMASFMTFGDRIRLAS